jgi:hypothetical protein
MIKKLVLAILLAYTTAVSAQNVNPTTGTVSVTPNVIDPSLWTPVIPMNSSQLGQVEGAGGGPIPALNTDTNTIRFSFMPYTVSQVRAIEQVLSGNGIKVSGFNYSWQIYNDLSNESGTRGPLNVTGQLADKNGSVLESYFEDYSNFNTGARFVTFSGTENFSKSYNLETLGYIGLAWTGSDTNIWSGYYGPRVRNTSLTLNYSVAPTSPSTPTTPSTTATVAGAPTPLDIADTFSKPPPESDTATQQTRQTQSGSQPPPGSEPAPGSQPPPNGTPTSTPSSNPPPSNEQVRVADTGSPNTNRPREERSQISASSNTSTNTAKTESNTTSGPSLSSVMSMIQSNQARENNIAMSAVAQSNEVAQTAVAQAEKTAIETASNSLIKSLDVARDSAKSETKDNKTNVNSSLSLLPSSSGPFVMQGSSNIIQQSQLLSNQLNLPVNTFNNQQQQSSSVTNNSLTSTSGLYSRPEVNISLPPAMQEMAQQSEIKPASAPSNISIQQVEQPNNSMSLFARRGDPLTDYIEQNNILVAMAQPETKSATVKTNVQDNELAGIVRIERMAVTPVGFNVYSLALRDVAFYQPKEIYKNVVIKDNVRTMYFIEKGNTDTYNKMIEAQYK